MQFLLDNDIYANVFGINWSFDSKYKVLKQCRSSDKQYAVAQRTWIKKCNCKTQMHFN